MGDATDREPSTRPAEPVQEHQQRHHHEHLHGRPRLLLISEESVYGSVLVGGMIVVSRGYGATSWETFLSVLGTVLVFWIAHVYAGTVAEYHTAVGADETLRTAVRHAILRSIGFLTAAIAPSIVLLLGAFEAIPDDLAVWVALWLGVAILAVVGYRVFAWRGHNMLIRIVGSLATAMMGVAMILLKVLIH